jgi:hypothetical protein
LPDLEITPGGSGGDADLLALFDEAVVWLVARGQTRASERRFFGEGGESDLWG